MRRSNNSNLDKDKVRLFKYLKRKRTRLLSAAVPDMSVFGLLFILEVWGAVLGIRSLGWEEAPGKVETSYVKGYRARWAYIRYSYSVTGVDYTNDDINSTFLNFPETFYAGHTVKEYPAGSEVTVFYNPSRPEDSLIEKGIPLSQIGLLLLYSFFLGLGFTGLWKAERAKEEMARMWGPDSDPDLESHYID